MKRIKKIDFRSNKDKKETDNSENLPEKETESSFGSEPSYIDEQNYSAQTENVNDQNHYRTMKSELLNDYQNNTYKKNRFSLKLPKISNPFKKKTKFKAPVNEIDTAQVMEPTVKPKKSRAKLKRRLGYLFKTFIGFAIMSTIIIVLLVNYIVLPGKKIYDAYKDLKSNAYSLLNDIQNKDLSNIDNYVNRIDNDLSDINTVIDKYEFLSKIDATKGYYRNFQVARGILKKINVLIDNSLPKLKNLLQASGFKDNIQNSSSSSSSSSKSGTPTTPSNSQDDKAIALIMKEFPQYLDLYTQMEPQIVDILNDVKKINLNYVPDWGNLNIKDTIIKINKFADIYPQTSTQVMNFVKNVPPLLGVNGDTKYLLVLQTEAEMRASGGIFTEYGSLTMHNGEFVGDISLEDMWKLHDYVVYTLHKDLGYRNIYGQLRMMEEGCGGAYLRPQDVGQYPDLFYDMNVFKDYYNVAHKYNPAEFPDYQYIILIDNSFANNLLKIVQPVNIDGGLIITADNFFDVIKGETDNTVKYRGVNTSDRKTIIKVVANAVKTKFLTLKITDVPKVVDSIIESFQAKDISLYTQNSQMQQFFDDYGLTARTVKNYTGDYFQLSEAQNCSLKLNRWVRDNVVNNITINNNGSINENVHIHWIQPQIYNPSLIHQYEPTLNHSYRAWIRIFMPNGSTNIKSDGYRQSGYLYYTPIKYHDSVMDKEVSDNIIQFDHRRFSNKDPIDKKDLNISYSLPSSINYNKDGQYTQILQKHPGKSWGEQYNIIIHQGNSSYNIQFTLDRDKILTFKNGAISIDNYDKRLDWITDLVNSISWDSLGKKKTS